MPPNPHALRILAEFASDEQHKEKLEEMSSMTEDGIEIYYEYISREKRNIYEILYDFDSVKIPINYLIEALGNYTYTGLVKPREYSISSSFKSG